MERKITNRELFIMSNEAMLDALASSILVEIPTGIDNDDDLTKIEFLLGKLANDYVYLISLCGYARNYVRQIKRQGKDYSKEYEDMMDKRDSLESIASAVKIQYQAVSRLLTVRMAISEEKQMHDYRMGGR